MKLLNRHLRAMRLALACLLVAPPGLASGQTIYRFVSPEGHVTFTDKPPAPDIRSSAAAGSRLPPATADEATESLPYELRQIANRYPVTLLTADSCAPCNSGRTLLIARGIPFTERTVASLQDGEALKRLSSDTALPVLIIGRQQLKGFSDAEWQQFLTAAGYPLQSRLPAGYRPPPATPLVRSQAPGTTTPPIELPPPPVPAAPANPAGIVF